MDWKHERARLAVLHRHHPNADHSGVERDLRAARLYDHIKRTVDAAPPLTPAQLNKLCLLLGGGDTA